ncbi:MAG: hypothetical protein LBQ23_00370, partial [Puniceicoccales bacterium]|nr:hypothetical protein [Puniceicoccales bacterium]
LFVGSSIWALPLFNDDGSLTEGSKYLCQALELDGEITNAYQFMEFFEPFEYLDFSEPGFFDRTTKELCEKFNFNTKLDSICEKVLKACELLGMKQAVLPKKTKYDYVLILGPDVKYTLIFQFIKSEMADIIVNNPGTKIFVVTSQRPLDPTIYSVNIIKQLKERNWPQTERYAIQLILERELGQYQFTYEFIDGKENDEWRNMITRMIRDDEYAYSLQDSIKSLNLSPGAMVGVTINPFIELHGHMLRDYLGHQWFEAGGTFEIIGHADDLNYNKILNNIKDQNIKSRRQRATICYYLQIIASCASAEIKQLTVKEK